MPQVGHISHGSDMPQVGYISHGSDILLTCSGSEGSSDTYAVILGIRGALKGGKARANKLTPERRKEIAKKAAAKRWEKAT